MSRDPGGTDMSARITNHMPRPVARLAYHLADEV
jgi:hypothetical protein